MKIGELWEEYRLYTKELTKTGRRLAFAAGAICWFFKTPEMTFPAPIYFAFLFLVLFFFLDIMQLLVGALTLKYWLKYKERQIINSGQLLNPDVVIDKAPWLNSIPFGAFVLKNAALICTYLSIFLWIFSKMKL